MLETGRVGGVSCDGNVDALFPHDLHALAYIIGTVAAYAAADTLRVAGLVHDLELAGEVVELSLNVCETVDAADDLGSIFSKAVEDDAERFLANLVGHLGDLDGAFSGSVGLVACEECEALGLLAEKTGCEVAVAETYLAVVSY